MTTKFLTTVFAILLGAPALGANYKNTAAFNMGSSTVVDKGTALSTGLQYEHRLKDYIGVGLIVDWTTETKVRTMVGLPLYFHPYQGFKITAAQGFMFQGDETDFAFRAGLGYDVEINKYLSLSPGFYTDIGKGNARLVYLVGLQAGFDPFI